MTNVGPTSDADQFYDTDPTFDDLVLGLQGPRTDAVHMLALAHQIKALDERSVQALLVEAVVRTAFGRGAPGEGPE